MVDKEKEREVTKNDGEKLKKNYGFDLFIETSARTGYNVVKLFNDTAKLIYKAKNN